MLYVRTKISQLLLTFLVALISFTLFLPAKSSAQEESRKVSEYKTFTEICLDRENLPKATKESVEILISVLRNGKNSCEEVDLELGSYTSLNGISDLELLKFTPNLVGLSIDANKVVSSFTYLESLENLEALGLSAYSLDVLKGVRLKKLRVLNLTISGSQLASDVNAFKMFPNFANFLESNDTNYPDRSSVIFPGTKPNITLRLNGNILTDISALQSAKGLVDLKLQGQNISNIKSLSSMIHLKELDIYAENVSDIEPLGALIDLESLIISGNDIYYNPNINTNSDRGGISRINYLVKLFIANLYCNNIENPNPPSSLSELKNYFLNKNHIEELDLLRIRSYRKELDIFTKNFKNDISSKMFPRIFRFRCN